MSLHLPMYAMNKARILTHPIQGKPTQRSFSSSYSKLRIRRRTRSNTSLPSPRNGAAHYAPSTASNPHSNGPQRHTLIPTIQEASIRLRRAAPRQAIHELLPQHLHRRNLVLCAPSKRHQNGRAAPLAKAALQMRGHLGTRQIRSQRRRLQHARAVLQTTYENMAR